MPLVAYTHDTENSTFSRVKNLFENLLPYSFVKVRPIAVFAIGYSNCKLLTTVTFVLLVTVVNLLLLLWFCF